MLIVGDCIVVAEDVIGGVGLGATAAAASLT